MRFVFLSSYTIVKSTLRKTTYYEMFNSTFRGGSRCTRLLLYFNTNKPHSFFWQNTGCIREPQVISGGGGAHPLYNPPRSAPDIPNSILRNIWNFTTIVV